MVMDEVIRHNDARKNGETADSGKKKKDPRKLKASVQEIWAEIKRKSFKILNKNLEMLIRWKKQKGDAMLPSHRKDDLFVQWNGTKDRNSPQVSLYSSDAEGIRKPFQITLTLAG